MKNIKLVRRLFAWALLTVREDHDACLKGMASLKHLDHIDKGYYAPILEKAGVHYFNTKARFLAELAKMPDEALLAAVNEKDPYMARALYMNVLGIGRKTASMLATFVNHGKFAILDVHVQEWMKQEDIVPPDTKQLMKEFGYDQLEQMYIDYCKAHGKEPLEQDFEVWGKTRGTKLINTPVGWTMPEEDWLAIKGGDN